MRKTILLFWIFFLSFSGVYAQKFETEVLDEGNTYEVRIKHFNKLFGEEFTPEKVAELPKDKAMQREKWREACADTLLSNELKQLLKQVVASDGNGTFWVTFYTDETGKVLTVKFVMSASFYINIPMKVLRTLFNQAMKEKLVPENYNFDQEHTYALDAVELVTRSLKE